MCENRLLRLKHVGLFAVFAPPLPPLLLSPSPVATGGASFSRKVVGSR